MERPPVFRLTDAEKDALIVEQAALIERLAARVSELESLVGKAKKTSSNSHQPPSSDGPGIRSLLAYLHHSRHVGFERLSRMLGELFGLKISEGAIANSFRRMSAAMEKACASIKAKLLTAPVIASDETTTRVDGVIHWQWVFHSDQAVLHEIVPSRGRAAAEQVLRDVQYAIDCGDTVVASKIRDLLRWAIRVSKRRPSLKDSTLAAYAAKADSRLDVLLGVPAAHPAGRDRQRQIKAWRTKFFVFMTDRRAPPTNNRSEQEIRPSVVFRKVTNGFRSKWGPKIHAGYRSVTGSAKLQGSSARNAIRSLIDGNFALA